VSREIGVRHPELSTTRPVQYDHVQWDWDSNDYIHRDYTADHANHDTYYGHPQRG
jgi:hypothetical protein